MNDSLGPFTLVLLVIPAVALRIAVRALFGRNRLSATEPMQLLLTISSSILFFAAVLGFVAGLIGFWWPYNPSFLGFIVSMVFLVILCTILLVVVMMVIDRSRQAEHRALVWALAAAAERGISLSEAARAFADEVPGDTSMRSLALAEAIERGQPLSEAVRAARLRMGTAMRLAIRLGQRLGMLGPAMRQQLGDSQALDAALRDAVLRLVHLGTIVAALLGIWLFMTIKIIPPFRRIFFEFNVPLPFVSQWVINASGRLNQAAWAFGVAYLAGVFLVGVIILITELNYRMRGPRKTWIERQTLRAVILLPFIWPVLIIVFPVLFYVGWFPRNLPILWRLFRRYDGAVVMRGLALAVGRGIPLPEALGLLADSYPLSVVGARLREAADRIVQGADWRASLQATGFFSATDVAVLGAAERVGNLPWAMEEMAEGVLRREIWRVQALIFVLYPAALLLLAVVIFLFVAGLFLPVVTLIHNQIPL